MHFSSEINRPPYEAGSEYLQVTSGCSHNKCEFCTLFKNSCFRVSPLSEVKEDLAEIRIMNPNVKRIFLQGADPFVLSYDKLMTIAELIHEYLPGCESIGAYARVTSMKNKSVQQLMDLHKAGYDGLFVGIESGDDTLLTSMNKGYTSDIIIEQCLKLEKAGIGYITTFLNGLGGHGYGMKHAQDTVRIFNAVKPKVIFVSSLTLFDDTPLYEKSQNGKFEESSELERLNEMMELISKLTTSTIFMANHVSISVPIMGMIPDDKEKMLSLLQKAINNLEEANLRRYRANLSRYKRY